MKAVATISPLTGKPSICQLALIFILFTNVFSELVYSIDAPFPLTPDTPSDEVTYFDVDWNGPPHTTGYETATGGTNAPSRVIFGSPEVETTLAGLSDSPVVFNTATSPITVEEIAFTLGQGDRVYSLSFDVLVSGHGYTPPEEPETGSDPVDGTYGDFSILFEGLSGRKLSFDHTGDVLFHSGGAIETVGTYTIGQPLNLRIQIDLDTLTFYFSIDGNPFNSSSSNSSGNADLESIHFSLIDPSRTDGVSGIDNVLITGFSNADNPPTFSLVPPTGITLDESIFGRIGIQWNPILEADYYEISWRRLGDPAFSYLTFTTETEYLDENLAWGHPYGYTVEAFATVDGVLYRSGPSAPAIGFAGNVLADLAVGRSSSSYKGLGINNATANGQRHASLTSRRGDGSFYVGAFNSGTATGPLYVQASKPGRYVTMTYRDTQSGENVTAGFFRGDYVTESLSPDQGRHYRCTVAVRFPKKKRKRRIKVYKQEVTFAAMSVYSPIRQDVAQAASFTKIPKKKKKKKRRRR